MARFVGEKERGEERSFFTYDHWLLTTEELWIDFLCSSFVCVNRGFSSCRTLPSYLPACLTWHNERQNEDDEDEAAIINDLSMNTYRKIITCDV